MGWGSEIPGMDAYTKEPPMLPPHLRHILLNTPVGTTRPQELPDPQVRDGDLISLFLFYYDMIMNTF
jgi:hypothetical protein